MKEAAQGVGGLCLMTRGGRGVRKPPKHDYVIHGCSLMLRLVRLGLVRLELGLFGFG
jgi:hypothetical protein